MDPQFCRSRQYPSCLQFGSKSGKKKPTPFPILLLGISCPLDNIVSQYTGRLKRMLDLQGRVDGGASVIIELFPGFGTSSEEDPVIIYIYRFKNQLPLWLIGLRVELDGGG